jgi:RNA polymerase sigma-70 factor (ECF subfamily)
VLSPCAPAASSWSVPWSFLVGPFSALAGLPVVERHERQAALLKESDAAASPNESEAASPEGTQADECATPEQAFERHFSMVWRSLRRLGVSANALDDAAQDVFLVLHRRWLDFQHQSSLKTWIYGIALRVASDHKRRARRERARWSPEPVEIESTLESPNESPDRIYQQREASRLLHEALGQLDDKERQIVVFVDLEEGSVVDAAEALGINLNTAYSRLRRGRQSFEKALRAASRTKPPTGPGGTEGSPLTTETNGD